MFIPTMALARKSLYAFLILANRSVSSLTSSGSQGCLFCGVRGSDSDLRFSGLLFTTGVCWARDVEGPGFCGSGFFFRLIGAIESLSKSEPANELEGGEWF